MWSLLPNETPEQDSEASSYGGYTGRKEYEKKKEPRRVWLRVLGAVGVAAVLALAALGVTALVRGDFSGGETVPETEDPVVVRVPSAQIAGTVENLVENTREYTVTLTLEMTDGSVLRKTGFIVTSDGCVLTDAVPFRTHSVKTVTAVTRPFGSVSAEFIGLDEVTGIAVVRLQDDMEYGPVLFANSEYVKSGAEVFSVSASEAEIFYGCVLSGRIMTVVPHAALYAGETLEYEGPVFYTDFPFNSDCSGAPLMDAEGRLAGFCSAAVSVPYRSAGAVIPASSLSAILNRILVRASLGE